MYTNIEFLGTEPIENMITSMHFQMDRIIFFGYQQIIKEYRKQTECFLKKYCNVKEVVFHAVSPKDLSSVVDAMKSVIVEEQKKGNELFFDVTGGESLILVAFGMLSKEYDLPMHMYDIEEDKLIELNKSTEKIISKFVKKQKVELTLERYIEMRGAKINHELDKKFLDKEDEKFMEYVRKLWLVIAANKEYWNPFSDVLKSQFAPNDDLYASADLDDVAKALKKYRDFHSVPLFKDFLTEVANTGALVDLRMKDGRCSFRYHSFAMKECLWKGGTILELHVYEEMKKNGTTDVDESVHIDWDGYIYGEFGKDVLNEIDVLAIKGNVPIFISCKSGKISEGNALQPMYELETVASRFGGKYARKVLATLQPITGVYAERAKEMGIELWCCE